MSQHLVTHPILTFGRYEMYGICNKLSKNYLRVVSEKTAEV